MAACGFPANPRPPFARVRVRQEDTAHRQQNSSSSTPWTCNHTPEARVSTAYRPARATHTHQPPPLVGQGHVCEHNLPPRSACRSTQTQHGDPRPQPHKQPSPPLAWAERRGGGLQDNPPRGRGGAQQRLGQHGRQLVRQRALDAGDAGHPARAAGAAPGPATPGHRPRPLHALRLHLPRLGAAAAATDRQLWALPAAARGQASAESGSSEWNVGTTRAPRWILPGKQRQERG